jgi:hypothetical protein
VVYASHYQCVAPKGCCHASTHSLRINGKNSPICDPRGSSREVETNNLPHKKKRALANEHSGVGRMLSELLDPDFWVTVGSELLDPAFWETVWRKLRDAELWRAVWKAFTAPEVAIPLIPLLLIALYVGRKTKSRIDAGKIKGIEAQIEAANQHLILTKEQRSAGADVERELEALRKQVIDLKSRFESGAQHQELATSVGALTQTLAKLCSANDELQRKFIQSGPSNKPDPHRADKG